MLLFLSDINWLTPDQPSRGYVNIHRGVENRVFSGKLSGVLEYNKTSKATHYE